MDNIQKTQEITNKKQYIKGIMNLKYKDKQFTDSTIIQIKNDEIRITKNYNNEIKSEQKKQIEIDHSFDLYLKFMDILSVAKNCKSGDQFHIIIFIKSEEQEEEFQDQDDQENQESQQCLQLQILSKILQQKSSKPIQLKGRFVLTLSFELKHSETTAIKPQGTVSRIQQLQKQLQESEQRQILLSYYQQIYQKIVTKLNEIDASANQQNGNNNKSIFNLLNCQNNDELDQMQAEENAEYAEDEQFDSHQIQDGLQEDERR